MNFTRNLVQACLALLVPSVTLAGSTVYYSHSGALLHSVGQGTAKVAVLIERDYEKRFNQVKVETPKDENNLSRFGWSYDLTAFAKFYQVNGNKFAAKYVGNETLAGAQTIRVNGRSRSKSSLKAEATGNLVLRGRTVTVGDKPAATVYSMTGADPDGAGMEPSRVGHIHTHPTAGEMQIDLNSASGGMQSSTTISVHGGSPSPSDHSEYRRKVQGRDLRFLLVVVDSRFIHLYDDNTTIKIPH